MVWRGCLGRPRGHTSWTPQATGRVPGQDSKVRCMGPPNRQQLHQKGGSPGIPRAQQKAPVTHALALAVGRAVRVSKDAQRARSSCPMPDTKEKSHGFKFKSKVIDSVSRVWAPHPLSPHKALWPHDSSSVPAARPPAGTQW